MRMILERHAYAPELNQLHFLDRAGNRRGTMRAPGVMSHKEARAMFGPVVPGRRAIVSTHYPEGLGWLERTISGRATYAQAMQVRDDFAKRLAPAGTVTVKTRWVG
jgi:hypothetical protein